MAEILTADVITALLGLATTIATGLFALYLKKYGDEKGKRVEAEEQGDLIMSSGKKVWELAKAVYGNNEKAAPYIAQGDEILGAMEKGWADSKVKTPELEEYYQQLLALATEIGKALA